MSWLVESVLAEINDLIMPIDGELLCRLLEKLEKMVPTPWSRFDRHRPTELLKDFLTVKPLLTVRDGMTLTSSILRRMSPENYALFFSFDYDWRFRHVSRVLCEISPTLLARRLISIIRDETQSTFLRLEGSILILEQRLMNRVDNQMNKKTRLQKKLIPKVAQLLLEVTSYRDGILNRMPKFSKELGRGQFGVVYSTDSEWEGKADQRMEIAIKAMVPANDRQWGELAQEYFYMHYWMKQRHENVLQVLGVLIDHNYGPPEAPSTQVLLVLERCNYDLYSALKLKKYGEKIRARLAHEVIKGIRCLHAHGLCHRDIKLKNILIDSNHTAKISDMGFCRPESLTDGSIVGTPIHMPAEIFDGRYTKKVDIYAYGILLWYVFANTTRIPRNFERAPSKEELWRLVSRGVRPEYIEGIDQNIWEMMEQCWSPAPEDRPEPGHISAIFDEYRKL